MASGEIHEAEHEITVSAPADVAYRLVEDVRSWPLIFPPTVHVDHDERGDREERIRIWATANGAAKGWTSRRTLDPEARRIGFRQEVSQHPVASMGGAWLLEPLGSDRTRVRLTHTFQVVDDPENLAWVRKALDGNSAAELDALKRAAEQRRERDELTRTFSDTVRVNGPLEAAYDFIYAAGRWQERLPHVVRVALEEDTPNVQMLEMDTENDSGVHTTNSVRVCFPAEKIVYKQLVTPALIATHLGEWRFRADGDGTEVTSTHTVVLNRDAIPGVLGADATVADARDLVRDALGRNSRATLALAKAHAEREKDG